MGAPLPKVDSSNSGFDDIKGLTDILNSMFGTGTTSTSKSESPDSNSMGQADALLKKIMGDSNPADIDAMVGNILERAKQSFGPAAISANAAGVRAYSDSSLQSMRNEAMARATGEAAAAKLNAINAANNQATQLVTAKLKSSTQTQQKQKTSGSPGAQGLGIVGLGLQGYGLLKKKGVIDKVTAGMQGTPDATTGDFTAGGGFDGVDFTSDAAFSAPAADTSTGGIDSLLDFTNAPAVEGANNLPEGDAPINEGTGVAADATSVTTGDVVTGGYAMPPAQTVDPVTGIPNSMPPAIQDAEAIDAIPADLGSSLETGNVALDAGAETTVDTGAELAGEGLGDLYFPGAFTVANFASEGQLGEAVGQIKGVGDEVVSGLEQTGQQLPGDPILDWTFGGGTSDAVLAAGLDTVDDPVEALGGIADSLFGGGNSFDFGELSASFMDLFL